MNEKLKIVVIGGSGLIGTKLVKTLRERGNEAVPASPSSGVNTITGEGLAQALEGAQVVVRISPSFEMRSFRARTDGDAHARQTDSQVLRSMREHYFVTGTRIGAPLSLTRKTRNFAGFASLAFFPTR
jgi:uncharacterized protein YbjT (DUF2867 family)